MLCLELLACVDLQVCFMVPIRTELVSIRDFDSMLMTDPICEVIDVLCKNQCACPQIFVPHAPSLAPHYPSSPPMSPSPRLIDPSPSPTAPSQYIGCSPRPTLTSAFASPDWVELPLFRFS